MLSLPMETLSGWPVAEDPTALQVLGLLAGIPLIVFIVVFAIAKVGNMVKGDSGDDATASGRRAA